MPRWLDARRLSKGLQEILGFLSPPGRAGLPFQGAEVFGEMAKQHELDGVIAAMKSLPLLDSSAHTTAVAYGMTLVAAQNMKEGSSFYDGQACLDQLSRAKAALDIACGHELHLAETTTNLLGAAQRFVDSATVACTEWASTQEIFEVVYLCAKCESSPRLPGHAAAVRSMPSQKDLL